MHDLQTCFILKIFKSICKLPGKVLRYHISFLCINLQLFTFAMCIACNVCKLHIKKIRGPLRCMGTSTDQMKWNIRHDGIYSLKLKLYSYHILRALCVKIWCRPLVHKAIAGSRNVFTSYIDTLCESGHWTRSNI